jgi:hypothetical protein
VHHRGGKKKLQEQERFSPEQSLPGHLQRGKKIKDF